MVEAMVIRDVKGTIERISKIQPAEQKELFER